MFGLHRDTVRKMLAYSVPLGYRRQTTPRRPKLEPFTGVIDRILEADLRLPGKQRHTARRIFERLRDEYEFDGKYTIVKDYVRECRRQSREMFVPLSQMRMRGIVPDFRRKFRSSRMWSRGWWKPLSFGLPEGGFPSILSCRICYHLFQM